MQPYIFVLLGGVGTFFFVSLSGGSGGLFWGRGGFLGSPQAESSIEVFPSRNSRELFVNSLPGLQGLSSDMGKGRARDWGSQGLELQFGSDTLSLHLPGQCFSSLSVFHL